LFYSTTVNACYYVKKWMLEKKASTFKDGLHETLKKILEKSLPLKSQNNENDDLKIIIQYLGEIGKKTIEICDDTSKIEAVQGSFRKVIGMLTFVQKNQILQAKILNAIVVELQYDLNGTNIHESINNRRENLINAVMNVKELNQYNDANAHYINGK